jgi:hypothetical protein
MIVIKHNQINSLTKNSVNLFIIRVIKFLSEHFQDAEKLNNKENYEKLVTLINKSEKYGLNTEQHTVAFIIAAKYLGENFDEELPQAKDILTNFSLDPEEKARRLEKFVIAVVAELAK